MVPYNQARMMALEEAIPDYLSGQGIFDYIGEFDWLTSSNDKFTRNVEYMLNRSGRKLASPLVARLVDEETGILERSGMSTVGKIVEIRFRNKWSKIWQDFVDVHFLQLADMEETTEYGKMLSSSGNDALTKSGTETNTRMMDETQTETIDADNPEKDRRTIEGGYTDADTTANTRTGLTLVTSKGDTKTDVYGFNSSIAVPQSVTGPADAQVGVTEETSYGDNGLRDEMSGNIKRTYDSYVDETTHTGSKSISTSYGRDGRVDTLEFTGRQDVRVTSGTETASGEDVVSTNGYHFKSGMDKVEMLRALYRDPAINDFYEIVYSDIDTVLTCPVYV